VKAKFRAAQDAGEGASERPGEIGYEAMCKRSVTQEKVGPYVQQRT
jgi:hypothetical protein